MIKKFGETPDELDITKATQIDFARIMLELVLPQLDNKEFIRRERFLTDYIKDPIVGLALTACRPSVFNGFRDFSDLCLNMEECREQVESAIIKLYGSSGQGVYEVAHAEWLYEHADAFGALVEVAGTIPALENAKDIRCLFVAYVLQLRVLHFHGQTKNCIDMFKKVRKRIYETGSEELEDSLIAAECLYSCYKADMDFVNDWLINDAPNENEEIFMMDMFSYLVKMRCYLQTDQYMNTIILANKMLELLKPSHRPHDKCECYILLAMALYKGNDEKKALDELKKAFAIASKYHYVRLFADEGQIMVELLKLYKQDADKDMNKALAEGYDEKYVREIKMIAQEAARIFPAYLQNEEIKEFALTKTEQKVLAYMAEGLSNDEIGLEMDKKVGTIKYHTASIFKKFGASNRQQAINFARGKGII